MIWRAALEQASIQQPYVLLIDARSVDAIVIESMLPQAFDRDVAMIWHRNVTDALAAIRRNSGCVAIMAVIDTLPEIAPMLRTLSEQHPSLPLIVISRTADEMACDEAITHGAHGYGEMIELSANRLRRLMRIGISRKWHEEQLIRAALYDDLTGCAKRSLIIDRITVALADCARHESTGALLFVDLDDFKAINDRHGHTAGDAVLRAVANRMKDAVRRTDTVARIGGDEFAILMPELGADLHAMAVAKVRCAFAEPVMYGGIEIEVGASIGLAAFDARTSGADALLATADAAMYRKKQTREAA